MKNQRTEISFSGNRYRALTIKRYSRRAGVRHYRATLASWKRMRQLIDGPRMTAMPRKPGWYSWARPRLRTRQQRQDSVADRLARYVGRGR